MWWNMQHRQYQSVSAHLTTSLIPIQEIPVFDEDAPYDIFYFSNVEWENAPVKTANLLRPLVLRHHRLFWLNQSSIIGLHQTSVSGIWTVTIKSLQSADIITTISTLRRDFGIYAAVIFLQELSFTTAALNVHETFDWPILYDDINSQRSSKNKEISQIENNIIGRFYSETFLALTYEPVKNERSIVSQMAYTSLIGASELDETLPRIHAMKDQSIQKFKQPFNMRSTTALDDLTDIIKDAFPKVSIILVTYNNLTLTRQCIESLLRNTTHPNYEIIIIDNLSSDGSQDYLRQLAYHEQRIKIVLNSTNRGFAAANNQGILLSTGSVIVLLNNDTVVPRGWLWQHICHLKDPEVGLVGPRTNYCKGEAKIDVPYRNLTMMEVFAAEYMQHHYRENFAIGTLIMFCVAIRKDIIDIVGLLDEEFGIGMYEDDDYSERVRKAGYKVVCAQDIFIHHHGNAAFKKIPSQEYQALLNKNRLYFEQKWGREAYND